MKQSTNQFTDHLPIVCAAVALVLSAVPACFAQRDLPVKGQASNLPVNNSPTKNVPVNNKAPVFHGPEDTYIPGSEMQPVPEKTPAQSDEFVKSQKPTMDLATLLYKNNEFRQSLIVLAKLPQNEQVHYYTGLCYKGLGNFKDATTHFSWVAYYARDPKLKSYAFDAIRSMKPSHANTPQAKTGAPGGGSGHGTPSTIYSSVQAKQRSEELIQQINGKLAGEAREQERGR